MVAGIHTKYVQEVVVQLQIHFFIAWILVNMGQMALLMTWIRIDQYKW